MQALFEQLHKFIVNLGGVKMTYGGVDTRKRNYKVPDLMNQQFVSLQLRVNSVHIRLAIPYSPEFDSLFRSKNSNRWGTQCNISELRHLEIVKPMIERAYAYNRE